MGKLDGKVAIVTGAGQGIGKGEAIEFAKEGAKVVMASRTLSRLEEVKKEIEAFGGECIALECDVKDPEQVKAVVDKAVETYGTVDILMNNAQQFKWATPFVEYTDDDMKTIFGSGFMAMFHFMKAVFPIMKEKGSGVIINTGSASGILGMQGDLAYASNKEAIRAMTRCAAREWGQYGIRVNNFCPVVDTISMTDEQRDFLPKMMATGRIPTAEEVARGVIFLASDDSSFMTGGTLNADGGLVIDAAR